MLFESEQDDGQSHVHERRRRHGLHSECGGSSSRSRCTKKTLVAVAAALVCLSSSSPVVFASSRHLPPSRHVSRSRSPQPQAGNRFRFASARTREGHRPRVPPTASAFGSTSSSSSSSSSSLRLSSDNNEIPSSQPPLNNTLSSTATVDDETRVTTTSFFRLPSETIAPEKLDGNSDTSTPSESLEQRKKLSSPTLSKPSQAQIHKTFVVCLMGISGFVEGLCIRRHGCFPNLMTGTMLKVAEAVGNLNFSVASIHASMIGFYIGGSFIFSRWKKQQLQSEEAATSSKQEQHKSSLVAVSMLSGVFLLLSDILGGIPVMRSLKLPLLAAAYGIINAGTVDVGAGVTYAMTGHVAKVSQGLATGAFARKDPSKPSAQRTSAQGLAFFWVAALVANLACGVLEKGAFAKMNMMAKLPLGTTIAVVYAWLFRWYTKASASAAEKTL